MRTTRIIQLSNADGLPVAFNASDVIVINRALAKRRTGPKPTDTEDTEMTVVMIETEKGATAEIQVSEPFDKVKAEVWPSIN